MSEMMTNGFVMFYLQFSYIGFSAGDSLNQILFVIPEKKNQQRNKKKDQFIYGTYSNCPNEIQSQKQI